MIPRSYTVETLAGSGEPLRLAVTDDRGIALRTAEQISMEGMLKTPPIAVRVTEMRMGTAPLGYNGDVIYATFPDSWPPRETSRLRQDSELP